MNTYAIRRKHAWEFDPEELQAVARLVQEGSR